MRSPHIENGQPAGRSALLILTGISLLTMVGIESIPLERHEAFVLDAASEMLSSGEWIVPRFNQELRLEKPPASYWVTAAVSRLDPFNDEVQIWHGRLVSLLAGWLIVLATARAGTALYAGNAGLLSGLLLMTMPGFIHLSHNARPDLLYAAFCVLQLFAWVDSWQAGNGSRRQLAASLCGWLAAALATLTKGPQVPAVFLLGMLVFLISGPDRKRILNIIRPLAGSLVFCSLVLPWWTLLQQRLQTLGVHIEDTELSGKLLFSIVTWKELLSGYYFYTLLLLTLPASLAIPFLLGRIRKGGGRISDGTRLLLTVGVTMLVVFTLGGHYRKHYLLPILPVVSLFLARAIDLSEFRVLRGKLTTVVLVTGAAAAAACAGLFLYRGAYVQLAVLSVGGYRLSILVKNELARHGRQFGGYWSALILLAALSFAGFNAYFPLDRARAAEQTFARHIRGSLEANDVLVEWKSYTETLPYYAGRRVERFSEPDELEAFLKTGAAGRTVFVVLPAGELPRFRSLFDFEIRPGDGSGDPLDGELTLVRLPANRGSEG